MLNLNPSGLHRTGSGRHWNGGKKGPPNGGGRNREPIDDPRPELLEPTQQREPIEEDDPIGLLSNADGGDVGVDLASVDVEFAAKLAMCPIDGGCVPPDPSVVVVGDGGDGSDSIPEVVNTGLEWGLRLFC